MIETLESQNVVDALKTLEIRSKDWLENSPICTKVVDPQFNLQYMSRAGIQALNIKNIDALYGKPFPLDFYPEEFRKTMCERLKNSKNTGKVRIHEGMIKTEDNKELWFESTISPIYDKQRKLDYFMVVSVEISARKKAAAKDLLLKEIHHRIKNNLQVVSSLLSLQIGEIDNPEFNRMIQNSKQRIAAMSLVHEKMYESEVSGKIYVKPYIEDLVTNISSSYGKAKGSFKQDFEINRFKLDMDILVPCSLILNEIITNVFKYGFESNDDPCIKIHVNKLEDEITIVIADNGPGLNEKEGDENRVSLGMKLIKALAIQINATIQIDSSDKGVCYTLNFTI